MKLRLARAVVLAIVLAGGVACDKPAPARSNDTAAPIAPPPPPPDSAAPVAEILWDTAAGPIFLVVGANGGQGAVVFPRVAPDVELDTARLDAASFQGKSFELLAAGRIVGTATLAAPIAIDVPEDCSAWPTAQLTAVGESTPRSWVVGFEAGRVAPVPYDSITGLSSSDSSKLAVEIARVASSIPHDTVPELKGTPYKVRRAYRFAVVPGTEGVIAEVVRTLNQEANPKQEHLLLIAERDGTTGDRYVLAYSERSSGGEETLESSELLAVARAGGATNSLEAFIARYIGDGVQYALLERIATRQWRLRWSSAYAGC